MANRFGALLATTAVICAGSVAVAQSADDAPLSAIDWLSESLRDLPQDTAAPQPAPRHTPPGNRAPAAGEPPVADSVQVPPIEITPLSAAQEQPIGMFAPSERGLPGTLWAGSDARQVADLVRATGTPALPALQDLLRDLIMARAANPRAGSADDLLRARIDQRLGAGALDDARFLIDAAQPGGDALFRRQFDTALLTGDEDTVCSWMRTETALSPSWPAKIFCLARGGDWTAAALTLGTARALSDITDAQDALLSRFLDPDLYEDEPPLPRPGTITPLEFRMREAIGMPVPTQTLPVAFANSDMRPSSGRKFRIQAAERLARSGALPPEQLLETYRGGRASASGGVWDRVAAIQALDTALIRSDKTAAAAALPEAYAAMQAAQSEVAFAKLWGATLARMDLPGDAGDIAHRLGLLSPAAASIAGHNTLADSIASGAVFDGPIITRRDRALRDAFGDAPPPPAMMALAEADRSGEAILQAIALIQLGQDGDTVALRDALATLRALGMEQTARRAALQLLLLERP